MSHEIIDNPFFSAGMFVGKAPLRPVRDYISGLDGDDVYAVAVGDAGVADLMRDIRQTAGTDKVDRPDSVEEFRREFRLARVMESIRVIRRR